MNRDIERELFEAMKSIKVVDEESAELTSIGECIDSQHYDFALIKIERLIKKIQRLKKFIILLIKENQRLKKFIISLVQEYELEEWLTKEHQELWGMLNDKKEPDTDSETN